MAVSAFHPILYVDDPYAERAFYALFGFHTTYEGPEFPDFLAITQGTATIGLSTRPEPAPPERGVRWQFIVDDIDDIVATCKKNELTYELVVERGGDAFETSIVKVQSPNRVQVWFEGPNQR